jgi:dihydroorotase
MNKTLIKDSTLINEDKIFKADLLIEGEIIKKIATKIEDNEAQIINAEGLYLIPGLIDDQVHFRDPGLTHKGDLESESKAAIAGGITSFMEMPNTNPRTVTQELLVDKFKIGDEKSYCNFSFYMGTANDNLEEVLKTDPKNVCGIKIFLGASTGNMLVNNPTVIEEVLKYSAKTGLIVDVHSESEDIIQAQAKIYKEKYGDSIPVTEHHLLRSREACIDCTKKILAIAIKTGAYLNILHLSTKEEIELIKEAKKINPNINCEVCTHHLWFTNEDYETKGNWIKWNPAIKTHADREALRKAVSERVIDFLATDHAPHTIAEKTNDNYFMIASGGPLVQHTLPALLELYHQGVFSLETIIDRACHNPARKFKVIDRGFLKEGFKADLTLINLNKPWTVSKDNILYKCGWSPFEGQIFKSSIETVFVNGELIYNQGKFSQKRNSQRLVFDR